MHPYVTQTVESLSPFLALAAALSSSCNAEGSRALGGGTNPPRGGAAVGGAERAGLDGFFGLLRNESFAW